MRRSLQMIFFINPKVQPLIMDLQNERIKNIIAMISQFEVIHANPFTSSNLHFQTLYREPL